MKLFNVFPLLFVVSALTPILAVESQVLVEQLQQQQQQQQQERHDDDNNNADFFSIINNKIEGQGDYRCGASLIHDDIALTASFCAIIGDVIRVGYKTDNNSLAIRNITVVHNHPRAGQTLEENIPNDLAVIKLSAPVTTIKPLALNTVKSNPTDRGDTVYFAHAGSITDVDNNKFSLGVMSLTDSFSNKMLKGKLATYNFRQCHQEYKQFRTFYKTDPQEEFQFCVVKLAAGDDNDTVGPCDSAAWGSPLWTNDGVQVGIASQGSCDVDSPPFLYTRVERYVVWIREQICLLSENPPSYCE